MDGKSFDALHLLFATETQRNRFISETTDYRRRKVDRRCKMNQPKAEIHQKKKKYYSVRFGGLIKKVCTLNF